MKHILNYVMPYRCIVCFELTQGEDDLCGKCFKVHEFINRPYCNSCGVPFEIDIADDIICNNCQYNYNHFDKGRSLLVFNDDSRKLIHGFKFNDQIQTAKFFAKLFCNKYPEFIKEVDIIAPVPMYRWKRLVRLYNPPQILAKELHKYFPKIEFIPDLLIKSRFTMSQRKLTREERLNNLKDSIQINKKHYITNKKILLIDDVFTTGTTINYCSSILKEHKAATITFFTIART